MAFEYLSHKFNVAKVASVENTDVFHNIRKRKEKVVYSGQTTPENINLAYLEVQDVDSDRNLFLSDRSGSISGNRVQATEAAIFTATNYTIETSTFLLTDQFTPETSSLGSTPLFWKHLIPVSRYVPTVDSLLSVEVLDQSFAPVANISQLLFASDYHNGIQYGTFFNNVQNTYDALTGLFSVFYFRYSIKKAGVISTYVDLVDNLPVYREATFDDLDNSNTIKPYRKVYLIEENAGGFYISSLATNTKFGIIQTQKRRITIKKPSNKLSDDDWFVKLTTGQFFTKKFNSTAVVKYSIPELATQLFEPFFPYKTVSRESPTHLGGGLFRVANNNLVIDVSQDFHVTVEVFNSNGSIHASYSTATPGVGIRSVDKLNGIVDLYEKPISTRYVQVSYVYEEKEYTFNEVDFNPANNSNVSKDSVVIYVVPQAATLERTVFYLRVNKSGKVIYSSQAKYDINSQIAGEGFDIYGNGNGSFTYQSFIDKLSVESTLLPADPYYITNPAYLILGELYVGEAISEEDITIVDVRRRGGGILELSRNEIINRSFESIWNWDIGSWDGQPYPGNCSYFIEVPSTLLTASGGKFEMNSLRTVVEEHTALGVYPIIKTYGVDPVITSTLITDTQATLNWTDHGAGTTYNVYRSLTKNGPFTKLTGTPIAPTTYDATGLVSKTFYWFFITGVQNGVELVGSQDSYTIGLQTR